MDLASRLFKGLKELLTSSYPGQASALTSSIDQAGVKIFWFQLFATANFYGTCALAYYIPMARVWSKQVKRKFSTGFFAFLFQVVAVSLSVAGIKKTRFLMGLGLGFQFALSFLCRHLSQPHRVLVHRRSKESDSIFSGGQLAECSSRRFIRSGGLFPDFRNLRSPRGMAKPNLGIYRGSAPSFLCPYLLSGEVRPLRDVLA